MQIHRQSRKRKLTGHARVCKGSHMIFMAGMGQHECAIGQDHNDRDRKQWNRSKRQTMTAEHAVSQAPRWRNPALSAESRLQQWGQGWACLLSACTLERRSGRPVLW